MTLRLEAPGWELDLLPEIGGSIGALRHHGLDILRPAPPAAVGPGQCGNCPLVPFANRIARGRFVFRAREVALPVPERFAPHALHGEGWLRAWQVDSVEPGRAQLRLQHKAGAWPWDWTALQRFALFGDGLRIELSVCNDSDTDMPAGLGFHPSFPVGPETRLQMATDVVWLVDDSLIPVRRAPAGAVADWTDGPRISDRPAIDHCYPGWGGMARIGGPDGDTLIHASVEAGYAHVYTPAGAGYACVEPVPHRPDAVNAPASEATGLRVLAPGETLAVWMSISRPVQPAQ